MRAKPPARAGIYSIPVPDMKTVIIEAFIRQVWSHFVSEDNE
jgi:hypothetical protein